MVDGVKRSKQKICETEAKNNHLSNQSNCTNSLRGGKPHKK